jgi:hypothetical protein
VGLVEPPCSRSAPPESDAQEQRSPGGQCAAATAPPVVASALALPEERERDEGQSTLRALRQDHFFTQATKSREAIFLPEQRRAEKHRVHFFFCCQGGSRNTEEQNASFKPSMV